MQHVDVPIQSVLNAFVGVNSIANDKLYERVAHDLALSEPVRNGRTPIGQAGAMRNPFQRAVRWHQQTLRKLGILERVDRSTWALTDKQQVFRCPEPS